MNTRDSSLVTGSKSHKQVDGDVSRLLRAYYDPVSTILKSRYWQRPTVFFFKRTLFIVCAGNELFYISLYLMKWVHTPLSELGVSGALASYTWPQLMAYISFPICAYKNFVNLVQLWKASKILVGVDLAERAKAREELLNSKKD